MYQRGYARIGPKDMHNLTSQAVNPFTEGWTNSTYTDVGLVFSASYAYFCLLVTRNYMVVRSLWWWNGGTINGAATLSAGVYSDLNGVPYQRLGYGSALQASFNDRQSVSLSPYIYLPPGRYWTAFYADTTTNVNVRGPATDSDCHVGTRGMRVSATSLPATVSSPTGSEDGRYIWVAVSEIA